ncbi:MAG: YfiR family protein [Archangium sp.]
MIRLLTLVVAIGLPNADDPVVPAPLQAELLARVLRYDRAFPPPEGARAKVLVVHRDTPTSEAFARQLMSSLGEQTTLGSVAHDEVLVRFTSADDLAKKVREEGVRVVVFAPGFVEQAPAVSSALEGQHVLTVSATPSGVREGIVLGFDLVDGKPRMLLNLASSRRQQSDFRAEVLKLMTVVP